MGFLPKSNRFFSFSVQLQLNFTPLQIPAVISVVFVGFAILASKDGSQFRLDTWAFRYLGP